MGPPSESRITASDREHALDELSHHVGTGGLSLVEFDERCVRAMAAQTRAELAELFLDLPGCVALAAPARVPRRWGRYLMVTLVAGSLVAALVSGMWWWLMVPAVYVVFLIPQGGR